MELVSTGPINQAKSQKPIIVAVFQTQSVGMFWRLKFYSAFGGPLGNQFS